VSSARDRPPQRSASSDPSANRGGIIQRESNNSVRFHTTRVKSGNAVIERKISASSPKPDICAAGAIVCDRGLAPNRPKAQAPRSPSRPRASLLMARNAIAGIILASSPDFRSAPTGSRGRAAGRDIPPSLPPILPSPDLVAFGARRMRLERPRDRPTGHRHGEYVDRAPSASALLRL
jgi:hypothetical protein